MDLMEFLNNSPGFLANNEDSMNDEHYFLGNPLEGRGGSRVNQHHDHHHHNHHHHHHPPRHHHHHEQHDINEADRHQHSAS
eukprot:3170151-Amphidinium_carterae.1